MLHHLTVALGAFIDTEAVFKLCKVRCVLHVHMKRVCIYRFDRHAYMSMRWVFSLLHALTMANVTTGTPKAPEEQKRSMAG